MPAFLSSIPSAIPGAISRGDATVEPALLASSGAPTAFGVPVAVESGKLRAITTGDDATAVFGFLVKSYPTQSSNNDFTGDAPDASRIQSVLKRGHIGVAVNAGTASYGSPVFVRVATPSGAKVTGGVEAVADSTNTIQINAYFANASDSDTHAEIAFNL